MKIKKILLLAISLFALVFCFASCDSGEIGSYLENYDWEPEVIEDVKIDMYIIVGEGTTENAMTTVRDKINQHLNDKYHTTLNLQYITESEYAAKIADVTSANGANSGIVLINSKPMMDSLLEGNKLVDLKAYLDTKNFGKLNTQITPSLLDAAIETDASGAEHLFSVPNNHVIGEYQYVIIDKRIAKDQLNFTLTELNSMNTWESTEELRNAITTHAATLNVSVEDVVFVKNGDYAMRNEYTLDDGYVCNVAKVPEVTKDEVYSSAFAILAGTQNPDRAMEVIYAINTDVKLRNYLQYGVEYTNYTVSDGLVSPTPEVDSVYNMNVLYTGDVFNALFCEAEGWVKWNEETKRNGELQNADSIVYVPEEDNGDESDEG